MINPKNNLNCTALYACLFITKLWLDSSPDYKYSAFYHYLFLLTAYFTSKFFVTGFVNIDLAQGPSEKGGFSLGYMSLARRRGVESEHTESGSS
jgi:hypothetical protein